jgi:hypothetical protein
VGHVFDADVHVKETPRNRNAASSLKHRICAEYTIGGAPNFTNYLLSPSICLVFGVTCAILVPCIGQWIDRVRGVITFVTFVAFVSVRLDQALRLVEAQGIRESRLVGSHGTLQNTVPERDGHYKLTPPSLRG